MFRKSTISDKYGWWMGQNFCHPAGNFRHLLRTGEKWCNDLLLGGEAPSKLRLRWRGSHIYKTGRTCLKKNCIGLYTSHHLHTN